MNDNNPYRLPSLLVATLLVAACGDRAAGDDGYTFEYCEDSQIKSASCAGGICDPAPFTRCTDGSCVLQPARCPTEPEPNPQPEPTPEPEPEPSRFTFCEDGKIKTAVCDGGICDPAPFEDCGDGTCALSPATCPTDATLTYEQLADPTRVVACSADADCCIAFDFCPTNAYVIHSSQKDAVDALIAATEHDGCCSCGYPAVAVSCEAGHCVGRRVLGAFGHPKPDGSYDEACDGFFGGCFDPLPPSCPLGESSTSFITNYI